MRIGALIGRGLRLRLASQGITGTSFIQADFLDPVRHPPPEISWTPRHLYVPSAPSTMAALSSAAERVMDRLEGMEFEEVLDNVNALLVTLEEKIQAVDTGSIAANVEDLVGDLEQTVEGADIPGLSADARRAFTRVDTTVARIQRMLDGGQLDLQVTLENLRVTSENLRDLTETLRAQPSLIIRSSEPEASGIPQ